MPGYAKHFKCALCSKILGVYIFMENLTLEKGVLENFLGYDLAILL